MVMKQKQAGFSLLELLLVVAVGAILLLAGLAIYRNVTNNANVNEATRLLNVIKQETQRLFQGEGEYGTVSLNPVLNNADVIPSNARNGVGDSTDEIRHAYNGLVTITGTDDTFTVEFADIPQSACITLGQSYIDNGDPDFVGLDIDGTAVETNVTALNTNCDDTNDMTWEFF